MQIITDYTKCPKEAKKSVIALGNFDGVHKGHAAIISHAISHAKKNSKPSAVMTFEPHPVSVFKPDVDNFRLTDIQKKAQLIAELGVDYLFVIDFNYDFASIEAEDFIHKILQYKLAVSHVVIGYDFIFGHKRGGNANLLSDMSADCGYGFSQIEAVGGEEVFSSTKIRENLRAGKLEQAASMLGRNYTICGIVERGDGRGKSLGFPTTNINSGDFIRPKSGVYAVRLEIKDDNKIYNAVANIGTKPTFDGKKEEIEVHIFDFCEDVYGQAVEVEFVKYIRSEEKFANVEALKERIALDCKQAKELL